MNALFAVGETVLDFVTTRKEFECGRAAEETKWLYIVEEKRSEEGGDVA